AKDFLRSNERLKQDIGEVKDFGKFITGNINFNNGDGTAELNLKVIGERKEVNAAVELIFRSGHQWRVTAASYKNEAGETIDLLNPYESRIESDRMNKIYTIKRTNLVTKDASVARRLERALVPYRARRTSPLSKHWLT